jgi:hypothetical protein
MIAKQDRIKPRTPEDLERMYQFEEMRGFATKKEVENIKAIIPDVSRLITQEQAQALIDKAIEEALGKINAQYQTERISQ